MSKIFLSESMLLGGYSILVFILTFCFLPKKDEDFLFHYINITYILAYFINNPHFVSSYILLYSDLKKKLFSNFYNIFVSTIFPLLFLLYFLNALITKNEFMMSLSVDLMFFLVGWHYIKQIFGCFVLSSVKVKSYLIPLERTSLLFNLFMLWFVSYLNGFGAGRVNFWGFRSIFVGFYSPLIDWLRWGVEGGLIISLILVAFLFYKKYLISKAAVPVSGLVALLSVYIWLHPSFFNPYFFYIIPFFHSLQYFYFLVKHRKNKAESLAKSSKDFNKKNYILIFFTSSAVIALFLFSLVPNFLDKYFFGYSEAVNKGSFFLVSFLVFINIHHYFIDSVIWKSSNKEIFDYIRN